MKKRVFCLLFLCLIVGLLIPGNVFAQEDFVIDEYVVQMKVNENHAYDIQETLKVTYTSPLHGIYHYVPYKGSF